MESDAGGDPPASHLRGQHGGPDARAYGFLILMILIGSTTATAAKFAVRSWPVELLPVLRFGIAGLALLPIAGGVRSFTRMMNQDGWLLTITAAFCVPINQYFFLSASRLAPTTHVGLIYAVCPLIVLVFATLIGQERLVGGRVVGIVTTVSGAAVIGLGNLWEKGGGSLTLRGDLLLIGAVISWGVYLTVNKPLVSRHGTWTVLAGTFLVGAVMSVPLAVLGWPKQGIALQTLPKSAWWSLAHLALVVTPLGLACQNLALKRLDASQVAAVGNAGPVLTVLWGVWLLGEPFTPFLAVGGALTLGGILLASRPTPVAGRRDRHLELKRSRHARSNTIAAR